MPEDSTFALPDEGRPEGDPLKVAIPLPNASPLAAFDGVTHNDAPTPAREWKSAKKRGFTVELPSGHKALVRRTFDMFARMESGHIPNPLLGILQEMIANKREAISPEEMGEEALTQMIAMFENTIEAMMIEPRFQKMPPDAGLNWEPDEDAIGPADLSIEDKTFLFNIAQGGVADLATFRAQSADLMALAQHGQAVPDEAVSTD